MRDTTHCVPKTVGTENSPENAGGLGGGGGGTPLSISHVGMCGPKGYGFLSRFGLE